MIKLRGKISVRKLTGMVNIVPSGSGGGPLQSKVVYPSHEEQIIKPDEGYYGLSVVTAVAVPKLPACVVSVVERIPETVKNVVNIAAVVSVTAEKYYTHFLYNGVRLPKIPEEVLVEYPYTYILSSNTYMGASSVQPYIGSSGNLRADGKAVLYRYDSEKDAWVLFTNQTTVDAPIDGLRWANVDIPNGSATATDIYFHGSEPVPTE